ncbi:F-box only protein 5 [Lates japonicus]|uniref:F-box only protein 5 n=1 Tax=Lates japonicus TaxID=270547 RepID=A0AAD3N4C6_LATJO|nr:F-box only protein 5 [Lates japonicus]
MALKILSSSRRSAQLAKGGKQESTLDNTIYKHKESTYKTVCMFHPKKATMKCPRYEVTKTNNMEKSSANVVAAEYKGLHHKASPVKEPTPIKPQCPPAGVTTVLFSLNNTTRAVHNKENSTSREHDRTLDEGHEDSGYLSLHNSQIDDHHGDEEDDHIQKKLTAALLPSATHHEKTISPNNSPSKCQGRTNSSYPVVAASTPVDRPRRRTAAYSSSSTPSNHHSDPNLPILKFQQAVCEELAKSYRKNKRYDWSIVSKVAEDYLLDRVIGGQMGREYVDMFTSLLSRNMRSILTNILALLGDMDLISCKKVSRTWRKIICEDTTALSRRRQAEEALRSCKVNRQTPPSQKGNMPNSQCTRFKDYIQAASTLKQHESLRPCKRCGSPATHSAETQRATCMRLSCLFDFCTCCQEAFHGSTPCRTVQPRTQFLTSKTTPIIPGSARSKRNIRRL